MDAGVSANGLSATARDAGVHLLCLPPTGVSMSLEFERSACAAIVQCLPDAVLLVDGDLRVALANRAAAALFRLNPDRLPGVPVASLVTQPDFEDWLRDFGSRGTKVMEASLPGRDDGRRPRRPRR